MAQPTTRQQLIDYCLRRLGAPVIEINIDPDQIEDRVDDAFLFFRDFHFDGTEKVMLAHQMTSQDITNQYIQVPPPVISVTRVLPITSSSNSMSFFDIQYQMRLNDLYTFTSTSIIDYTMMMARLDLLDFTFNVDAGMEFTRHQGQIRIRLDWTTVSVGDYYIIECYRILDPDQYPDVYNDRFLKAYTTELFRRQFGENLMKYQGVALIGGVQLNGSDIYDKALANIDKLEQQAQDTYQLPISFIMG